MLHEFELVDHYLWIANLWQKYLRKEQIFWNCTFLRINQYEKFQIAYAKNWVICYLEVFSDESTNKSYFVSILLF